MCLGTLIDAAILMVLIQIFSGDEEVSLLTTFIIALVSSVVTGILAMALVAAIGFAGIVVAAAIAAVALGVVISAVFGLEINRSFAVAGIFMVAHIAVGIGFRLMANAS